MRAEAIQDEMANAVRVLGGDGSAKEQTRQAAQAANLPASVIERLRWKKIKRVPADVADAIREAIELQSHRELARAKHELEIAKIRNLQLIEKLQAVDPNSVRSGAVDGWG